MVVSQQYAKELIEFCKDKGLKRVRLGDFEAEFFDTKPQPMSLDPKDLAKVLTDSMPPDSAMLFASVEDTVQPEEPNSKPRETADMT